MTVDRSRGVRPRRILLPGVCLTTLLLCACHSSTIELPGTPVLTMGGYNQSNSFEFANYLVAIDALTLTRNDGSLVEPLSEPETIDLAKMGSMTELVEAPAVPEGTYLSATITFDYTAASILVIANGGTLQAVTPVDVNGTVLSTASVTITFDPLHPLVITNNVSNRVSLDIDLAAFNSIDLTNGEVLVQPFAVLTPAPLDKTFMRSRGSLVVVQSPNDFIINARPFYDLVSALGAITVNVSPNTYYNVNGATLIGTPGLAALSGLPINSSVAAYGTITDLSTVTPTFTAQQVYAGTSLESELFDYFTGTVASRTGNLVVMKEVTFQSTIGATLVYPSAQIGLDPGTIVSQDGVAAGGLGLSDISVGSQITAIGTASLSSTNALSMETTGGQVRLLPNQLWGVVKSTSGSDATVAVQKINNLGPNAFSFAGAAVPALDPDNYVVSTGSLTVPTATGAGSLLFTGQVGPFGSPPPNFTASAAASPTQQQLVIEWSGGGSTAPFSSVTLNGLVVNFADNHITNEVSGLHTGPNFLTVRALNASGPLITGVGAPGPVIYAIGNDVLTVGVQVFSDIPSFLGAVNNLLGKSNTTHKAFRLVAYGEYNSTTNTFVASRIYLNLQDLAATT